MATSPGESILLFLLVVTSASLRNKLYSYFGTKMSSTQRGLSSNLRWPHLFTSGRSSPSYQVCYQSPTFSPTWNSWTSSCLDSWQFCKPVAKLPFFDLPTHCTVLKPEGDTYHFIWLPSLWTFPPTVRKLPTLSVLVEGIVAFLPQTLSTPHALS